MHDWAAPLIASALFAFLCPGMIVTMPGKNQAIEFLSMKTTIAAMSVHAVVFCLLLILFFVVLDVHIYV